MYGGGQSRAGQNSGLIGLIAYFQSKSSIAVVAHLEHTIDSHYSSSVHDPDLPVRADRFLICRI